MSHSRQQHALISWSLLAVVVGIAACDSSTSVPQPVDAAAIDARDCACPGTELFSRQHLVDHWYSYPRTDAVRGHALPCVVDTDLSIGGTCLLSYLGDNAYISGATRFESAFSGYANWWCFHLPFSNGQLDMSTRCVRPLDRTGETPEGCTCPAFETPRDRIFYVPQSVIIEQDVITSVNVSCPAGTTRIGGACAMNGIARLLGTGPYPDDPQTWHCSWHHVPNDLTSDAEASAICLSPPAPDAVTGEPVTPETIEYVFVEETLPANDTRILSATCAPGDTLITGGCQIADVQLSFKDLQLKGTGQAIPEDNWPNTWQCSWRNPTNLTPKAIAMATCLKSASTSSTE